MYDNTGKVFEADFSNYPFCKKAMPREKSVDYLSDTTEGMNSVIYGVPVVQNGLSPNLKARIHIFVYLRRKRLKA